MRGLLEFGLSVETAWYSMHVRGVCVRVCARVCVCACVRVCCVGVCACVLVIHTVPAAV